jgi:hypothetical protein
VGNDLEDGLTGNCPVAAMVAGQVYVSLDPSIFSVSLAVLVHLAVPWPDVYARYMKARGDRGR